jgi:hypothetical protein
MAVKKAASTEQRMAGWKVAWRADQLDFPRAAQ